MCSETVRLQQELAQLQEEVAALRNEAAGRRLHADYKDIFNALPGQIAIVDAHGTIRSVNEAWKRFAVENDCPFPDFGVGADYLAVCEPFFGEDADTYRDVAACFTSVLSGADAYRSLDCPCHTPPQHRRWLQMVVSALDPQECRGVVVLHVDITERVQTQALLRHTMSTAQCILWYGTVDEWADGTMDWRLQPVDPEASERFMALEPHLTYADACIPEDKERILIHSVRELRAGRSYSQEFRCRDRDGHLRWVSENVQVEVTGENTWRLVGICIDITELRKADAGLRQIMSDAHCLLWYFTATQQPDGGVIYQDLVLDEAAAQRFFPVDVPPGKPYMLAWYDARLEEDKLTTDAHGRREMLAGRSYSQEYRCRNRDGEIRWLSEEVHVEAEGENSWRLVGVCTDITERKHAAELIEWHAYHDPLTQLPNRALFHDRVEQAIAAAGRSGHHVGLLFIDIDRFKYINDRFGHGAGDELLRVVSARFARCLRTGDTLARMGGDEFIILLPVMKRSGTVVDVAQRVLDTFAEPILLQGHELYVSASIGISLYPMDGEDAQSLIKHADIALYRVKERGRNGYELFTPAMNVAALERSILQSTLHQALEREEFVLYYQPQYTMPEGQMVGVEALVRWQHPELGLVGPDKFIPLTEETGLILPLGTWVLNTACRQASAWQALGQPLRVSVNVSAIQLKSNSFVDSVAAALSDSELSPNLLTLELTESALVASGGDAMAALLRLQELGICISVDDFGTGYSSLAYLSRLPLNMLKVDRSFVQGALGNPRDMAVVKAVIELAHTLGLSVVAEGVGHQDQWNCLVALGCDTMQGFLRSKPVAAQVLEAMLSISKKSFPV